MDIGNKLHVGGVEKSSYSNNDSGNVTTILSSEAKGKEKTKDPENLNEVSIFKREIVIDKPVERDENYVNTLRATIKHFFYANIKVINSFIKDENLLIKYDENDSLESLASKSAKRLELVLSDEYNKKQTKEVDKIEAQEKANGISQECIFEAYHSYYFLTVFFKKNNEKDQISKRKKIEEFKNFLNENEQEVDLKNLNINYYIQSLCKIKEKNYFIFIRKMFDFNLSCIMKVKNYLDYFGMSYSDNTTEYVLVHNFTAIRPVMNNVMCDLVDINILLESLDVFQTIPKSKHNLQLILDICVACFRLLEESNIDAKKSRLHLSPYGLGIYNALNVIKDFKNDLEKALSPKQEDDWSTSITKAHEKGKKKAPISNKGGRNRGRGNGRSNGHTNREEPKIADIEPKVESKPKATAIPSTVNLAQTPATTNLQDSGLVIDEIAKEMSELMRAFRQDLEKYRVQGKQEEEERLRIKQERDALTQLLAPAQPNPAQASVPVQVAPVADLKDAHISTWKALIVDKHLTVENADVNVLLTRLNGRSVGNGGSQFEIEFFDFNKNIYVRCGQYEDNHGQDRSDRLKKGQGKNVCQAIDSGMSRGLINISQETKDKVFGKIN